MVVTSHSQLVSSAIVLYCHILRVAESDCTVLLAEHKEQLGCAVFEVSVHVCHQSDQLVPQSVPLLWPQAHLPQGREDLTGHSAASVDERRESVMLKHAAFYELCSKTAHTPHKHTVQHLLLEIVSSFSVSPATFRQKVQHRSQFLLQLVTLSFTHKHEQCQDQGSDISNTLTVLGTVILDEQQVFYTNKYIKLKRINTNNILQ